MEAVYLIHLSRSVQQPLEDALSHLNVSHYGEALLVAPANCYHEVVWVLQNCCAGGVVLRKHHLVVTGTCMAQALSAVLSIPKVDGRGRFYPRGEPYCLGFVHPGWFGQAAADAANTTAASSSGVVEINPFLYPPPPHNHTPQQKK